MTSGSSGTVAESAREAESARRARIVRAVWSFRAGDDPDESFRLIYEAYYRPLQRFFSRKGLPREECSDLTQETLLCVFKGLEGYEEQARFEAWLYRLALNVFRQRSRAARASKRAAAEISVEEVGAEPETLCQSATQPEGLITEERRRALRRSIRDLPKQMRKCLILRLDQELTYREIAVVTKIKIDTVKAHLFQARNRLRDVLSDETLRGLESKSPPAKGTKPPTSGEDP